MHRRSPTRRHLTERVHSASTRLRPAVCALQFSSTQGVTDHRCILIVETYDYSVPEYMKGAERTMAVENTLLGLLKHQPRHGYDLAREFDDDTALAEVLHLEPSMLYAYLKKLESGGLIVAQIETNDPRPPRKIFTLTAAGEQVLQDWLDEPVTRTRDLRLEFLLKLYVARLLDARIAQRLVVRQRALCEGLVANLQEQVVAETDDFRKLVLEMRLAQNIALLSWLNAAREQVRA
ncbi:MAG: hypothetical protein DCC58_09545 [Chloroflexi bacterium]|nr:MAG: hypothetical protein DCC58_09545 [Chloroflexota bacterium]